MTPLGKAQPLPKRRARQSPAKSCGLCNCFPQFVKKLRHYLERIVIFPLRSESFDRQITPVTRRPHEAHKFLQIERHVAFLTKRALLHLPVDGIRSNASHIFVGVLGPEVAGVDDGSAPFGIYKADEFQQIVARLEKIPVILHADDHTVILSMSSALTQVCGDPLSNLIPGITLGDILPAQVPHLRIGEDTQHRSSQAGSNLDPLLDVLNVCGSLSFVRNSKVVAHAGAADADTEFKRLALEIVDVINFGNCWISRKEISGSIEAIEVVFGTEVHQIKEIHAALVTLHLVIEQLTEGVSIERELEHRAALALDRLWRSECWQTLKANAGRCRDRQHSVLFEKFSAIIRTAHNFFVLHKSNGSRT